MGALPMEAAAIAALQSRQDFAQAKDFQALELVELDAVAAMKRLLAKGSDRLRQALVTTAASFARHS